MQNDDSLYVKRIIGLPNEKLEIKGGRVYINDNEEPLDTPFYAVEDPDAFLDYGPIVIPNGKYFVIGDNIYNSNDSRDWSDPFLDYNNIVSKVFLQYEPEFKFI